MSSNQPFGDDVVELRGREEAMRKLNAIISRLGGGSLKVGFMSGDYPSGTPVAAVAFWNEFGVPSRNQPPRPFFRRMISRESPHWGARTARLARSFNYDGNKVLNALGEDIKGALSESIATLSSPPISPKTAARKGSNKPLVDTAQMLNSATFKVDR